jgi:hypothetical protein
MAIAVPPMKLITKRSLKRLAILFTLIAIALAICWRVMLWMPGHSHRGPLPPATDAQTALAANLKRDVEHLASDIGSRSIFFPRKIADAAIWLRDGFQHAGYADVTEYPVERGSVSPSFEVTLRGSSFPNEIVIVGAHYDAFQGTPGADDNASGCAAVLALARHFAKDPQPRTIRFLLFTNEEPPNFMQPSMGSWVYAKACRARDDRITAMLSLESIGYYSTAPNSQHYPPPLSLLFPSTGDFIAFVGNLSSRHLLRRAIADFRAHAAFPSEGAALPSGVPGVGWSDHWSFWQENYPAIMITDTALYRNANYHTPSDTPGTLDYDRLARAVDGLQHVITTLADPAQD